MVLDVIAFSIPKSVEAYTCAHVTPKFTDLRIVPPLHSKTKLPSGDHVAARLSALAPPLRLTVAHSLPKQRVERPPVETYTRAKEGNSSLAAKAHHDVALARITMTTCMLERTSSKKQTGKIIYASPGSGKSTIAEDYGDDQCIIDGDDLILEAIEELNPRFRIDYDDHPAASIRRNQGYTVLLGSMRLMHIADYVFIQCNKRIIEDRGYDEDKEWNHYVERLTDNGDISWNQVKKMNNYLDYYILE
eukprot:gene24030-29078_t